MISILSIIMEDHMSDKEVSDDSVSSDDDTPQNKKLRLAVKYAVKSFAPFDEIMELFRQASCKSDTMALLREVGGITTTKSNLELKSYVKQTQQNLYKTLVSEHPEYLTDLVNIASRCKSVVLLEILYQYASNNGIDFPITKEYIDEGNRIDFLEWWKDKLPSDYQASFIDNGPLMGKEEIVKWWVESGFQITINEESVSEDDYFLKPNVIRILHEASVKIPKEVIEKTLFFMADENGSTYEEESDKMQEGLDWLFQEYGDVIAELLMKEKNNFFPTCIMDSNGESYHLHKYVHAKGIPFHYTEKAVDNISNMNHAMFWEKSGLTIKHTKNGLIKCLKKDIELGRWWLRNGLDHAESYCVDGLINECAIESIQFLIDNGISVTCTEEGLDLLHMTLHMEETTVIKMLQFMIDSGLGVKCGDLFIKKCLKMCMFKVLDVLFEMGLLPRHKDFTDLVTSRTIEEQIVILAMCHWWLNHDLKLIMTDAFAAKVRTIPLLVRLLEEHGCTIPEKAHT